MTAGFVHLHLHTEYSITDSVVRVDKLMHAVAAAGMPAVAMTDQSNLFAMVKFYRAAMQAGLKPLIGADIWLREDRKDDDEPARLILLCRDNVGYRNLSELLTRAYLEGQELGIPVIRRTWLDGAADGLLALSGAREGAVGRHLLAGKRDEARRVVEDLRELFGGDFFIELQSTGRPDEEAYLRAAVELADETSCPVVATNDVRFLTPGDFGAHEARVCIQQGRVLDDAARPRNYSEQQYLRAPDEMADLFAALPEALENTVEIARRCTVELSLGESHLPEYAVPDGMSTDEFLAGEAAAGLCARFGVDASQDVPEIYRRRLETELGVIRKMGFPGYFLIVADFIHWAVDNDIPVGPGRGSGAGSLVAWALRITDLDPIKHELLFERFLNPERVSMPDFDIDFCMDGRDRVIDYVGERYGRDRVSQIITYGTMAAKAVVRDVGRVLGHPYGFSDRIAKLIPFEVGMTLDKALDQEKELHDLYASDDDVRAVIDLAKQLEGLVRNAGKHAGGVVIAPSKITHFTPLFRVEGEKATVTQFDKDDVEAAGLVKFDFLGLRTLTIIDHAVRTINEHDLDQRGSLDIRDIPMDDAATFDLLQSGNTTAVFQLESRGMRDLVRRLRPDHFDDIVALNALFRPGPLQSGMVEDFIQRKHVGPDQPVDYFHPDLEPVLRSTYGVILYQEQVMQIAQRLSGYSLGGADILRRAMGKKKPEEMARERSGFVSGAKDRGVDPKLASAIFDLVEKFAGYGFNKSHSAAYALLSYQTAWLKAHHAAALMAAVLSSEMDDTDRLVILKRDCEDNALTLLPPDINDSGVAFEIRDAATIRYGLAAVKGLGQAAAEQIIAARADGPFASLADFCERVYTHRIGRRALEALIKSGALDRFGHNRPSLLAGIPAAIGYAERAAAARESGQSDLFAMPPSGDDSRTVDAGTAVSLEPDWKSRERLEAERESLGLYMSGHPYDEYRQDGPFVSSGTLASLTGAPAPKAAEGGKPWAGGRDCTAVGLVTGLRKRGGRVTFELDDGDQRLEVSLFQDAYDRYRHLLTPESIVVVSGKLRFDDFLDGWRLHGKEVTDIDRVIETRADKLIIRWRDAGHGQLDPQGLKAILEPFRPGKCEISLFYARGAAQARLVLGPDWGVRPSRELRDQLAHVVGEDGYRFIYGAAD